MIASHTTMRNIAKKALGYVKRDIAKDINDLANPFWRAKNTLRLIKEMLEEREKEMFKERHKAKIAEVEAPVRKVLADMGFNLSELLPTTNHIVHVLLRDSNFAREILTEPIKDLGIEIDRCAKNIYSDEQNTRYFTARLAACKKAWELRTGKAYGEQVLAKTA